jgi:hypothetical protein
MKSNIHFNGLAHLCTVEKVGGVAAGLAVELGIPATESMRTPAPRKERTAAGGGAGGRGKKRKAAELTPGMAAECQARIEKARAALELQDKKDEERYNWVVAEWAEVEPQCADAFGFPIGNKKKRRRKMPLDMQTMFRLVQLQNRGEVLEGSNPHRQPEEMKDTLDEILDDVNAMIKRATDKKGGYALAPYAQARRDGNWPKNLFDPPDKVSGDGGISSPSPVASASDQRPAPSAHAKRTTQHLFRDWHAPAVARRPVLLHHSSRYLSAATAPHHRTKRLASSGCGGTPRRGRRQGRPPPRRISRRSGRSCCCSGWGARTRR